MNEHVTDDLGLYAAGLLEPDERVVVERHLASCSACREALGAEERMVAVLADAASRPVRPELRERVLASHRRRLPLWSVPRAAFALAAALVLVLGVTLVQTRSELERERAQREEYEGVLFAIAAGGSQIVPLQAPGPAFRPPRAALVIRSTFDEAYVVLDLPQPAAGKAYEAWVIRGGEPLRAGVAPSRPGVVTLRLDQAPRPGDIAAVTLEDAGGVDKPTSDPIVVGKI